MTLELETWRVPHSSWISRLGLGGGATQRARAPQTWLKPTSAGTVAPDNGEPDPVSGKVLVAEQRTPRWGRNPTCAEGSSLPFSRACLAEADQPGWTPGSQKLGLHCVCMDISSRLFLAPDLQSEAGEGVFYSLFHSQLTVCTSPRQGSQSTRTEVTPPGAGLDHSL